MNYEHPELLSRLAAEYVLGTMPVRSRRRFDALLRDSAAVRRALRLAEEQLLPFAAQLPPQAPPPRVWRAIEERLGPAPRSAPARSRWWDSLAFWRGGALVALGLFLALGVTQFGPRWWGADPAQQASMGGLAQTYVGVLSDRTETPAFLLSVQRHQSALHVKVLRPLEVPEGKVMHLWALPTGAAPVPLGALPSRDKGQIQLGGTAEALLSKVPFLAVSVEAPAGPAGGKPSGEFVYRGPCVKLW